MWLSIGGILVFLMIPAIGMLEAGLVRRVNVINAMSKGLMSFAVFLPAWFAVFPLFFHGIFSDGYYPTGEGTGVPMYIYGFFLGVFGAVTLALIGAGAPERLRFGGWLAFALFFSLVQWPLVASWIWGGGFLSKLGSLLGLGDFGVLDFAGGTVVHAYAGLAGFIITLLLGPSLRRAWANGGGRARLSPLIYKERVEYMHAELQYAILGTILLYFGWFGFNGMSTVTVSEQSQYAISNTAIAGSLAGAITALLSRMHEKVWNPIAIIAGLLGGLVMITPLAGFVDIWVSYVVGVLAGLVTYYGTKLVERYYFIDDPVGSLPVHGFNGILGSALVPVFAKPGLSPYAGLIYGGSPAWLGVQLLGMAIALLFVVATTYIATWLLRRSRFRISVEEELLGLDVVDHGVERP
ncbi:ammonium transporter [Pyrobaculum arsenaticum]|nr:ammonium transporter [Pyrobaculum arsenaticum]